MASGAAADVDPEACCPLAQRRSRNAEQLRSRFDPAARRTKRSADLVS
jgi:hypothetical protein